MLDFFYIMNVFQVDIIFLLISNFHNQDIKAHCLAEFNLQMQQNSD